MSGRHADVPLCPADQAQNKWNEGPSAFIAEPLQQLIAIVLAFQEGPHMAAISDKRATDERVTCLRIFADASGETHMEDVDIALQPRKLFKDNPPLRLSNNFAASWFNICHVPSGMHEVDWHNPPQRLLVLWLTGEVEFETSDGNIRRLPAGSAVLAEDTTGKGHISRHPPEGQLVVHVPFAEHQT
jgi:hypothetical protein